MCHTCEGAGRNCNIIQPCSICITSSTLCHYTDPDKLRLVWQQSVERYGRDQALERLANMVKEEGSRSSSAITSHLSVPMKMNSGILKAHHIDSIGHFHGETSGLLTSTNRNISTSNEFNSPQVPISPPVVSSYNQTHLLDSYFTHVHPRYPFISEKCLSIQLQARANGQPNSLSTLFLYAIFAAGAKMMPTNIEFSTKLFFDYCLEIKHLYMDRPRMSTICALALLSNCCPETISNGQSSKMLSAMLASESNTMARIMGLHRNINPSAESLAVQRDRCRVFWVLFVLDRLFSMNNGYPLTWDEKHIDIEPPVVEDYASDEKMAVVMQDFHYYVKLGKIVGRICNHSYTTKSEDMRTYWKLDTMLATLDSWLTSYILELPQHLRYDPSTVVARPRTELDISLTLQHPPKSLFARLLHLIAHTCLILLHSPYISDSDKTDSSQQTVASQPSLDLCIYAATLITHITSVMQQEYPIMASQCPYTSHSLLIAIRIHLMCAMSIDIKLATEGRKKFVQSANVLQRIAEEAGKMWIMETLHAMNNIFNVQKRAEQSPTPATSLSSSGKKMKMPTPTEVKRKGNIAATSLNQSKLRRKKSTKLGFVGTSDRTPHNIQLSSPANSLPERTIPPGGLPNIQVAAVVRSPSSASSTGSSPNQINGMGRDKSQSLSASVKTESPASQASQVFPSAFAYPGVYNGPSQPVGDFMDLHNLETFSPFEGDASLLYTNNMFSYPTNTQSNTVMMDARWQPPNPSFDPTYGFNGPL
ncbi:hypothetical protein INT44_001878 [Umbelopsis vinacea]|uniref:Xylanolytic transcriptional activator regulatory domain-containing protein n=1 Tax=Umbelopsis vinacea TaxID=44442 RepID=A0A8H7PS22_9FUNG|nr:hypothetical protein INT44_001878 [Umbelopsis vinacea]